MGFHYILNPPRILVGNLTQQAVFFVLCISLTNLNAGLAKLSVLNSFTMLELR